MKKKKIKDEEMPSIQDDNEQLTMEKEKFVMKKEYYEIGIAVIILIILVVFLIKELIVTKKYEVIVPDEPDYSEVDVGVIDMNEKNATDEDISSAATKELKVNYEVVSDYYKKGILLSNTQVDLIDDSFVVTSGPLSDDSFVSSISLDGKLNWIYKVDEGKYENFNIYKTVKVDDKLYSIGLAITSNNKKSLAIISLNEDGSKNSFRVIKEDVDLKIYDVIVNKKKIAIITGNTSNINIYFEDTTNSDKAILYDLSKNHSDITPVYQYSSYNDNYVSLVIKSDDKIYEVRVNPSDNTSTISELTDLSSDSSMKVGTYLSGYVGYTNQKIYKLNATNLLENTYDYSKIKLESEDEIKKYIDTDEEMMDYDISDNQITIEDVNTKNEQLIVSAQTSFSTLYDIFDSNFKLKKRYIINNLKYFVEDGIKLKSFYVDGKIYEVYSYGTKTPSIMISKIG